MPETRRDPVERGDGLGPQRPRGVAAFAGEDVHFMFLQVELNFEDALAVWHRPGRQPMGVYVQSDVPPMIDGRGIASCGSCQRSVSTGEGCGKYLAIRLTAEAASDPRELIVFSFSEHLAKRQIHANRPRQRMLSVLERSDAVIHEACWTTPNRNVTVFEGAGGARDRTGVCHPTRIRRAGRARRRR